MKKYSFLLFLFIFIFNRSYSQIKLGDNVNSINVSSLLELESTSKGLLFSRMNTSQMNAMTAVNGLTIFNSDSACLCNYNGTSWVNLCRTTTIPNLILTKTNNVVSLKIGNGNQVYFSVADDDSSKTNEIQTISFANDSIYLSLNGGKVGLKSLIIDTTSLSNRIIKNRQAIIDTATSLRNKINAHIAADLDTDTTNEMQTLSITGQTLRISKRNSVTLPSLDTTSLSNRINQRVKYTDTASMLAPYLRDADTASLSNRIIKNRQAIIDTATSLRNKINAHIAADLDTDTTNEMQTLSISGQTLRISKRNSVTLPSIDTTSLSNRINQRVKYTDTASMLAPYLRDADTASLSNRINKKLNANDTISLSNRINQRVKYTDTASMLAPYLRDADTASLSNRINKNRQAIIDTATSLRNKINAHIAADLDTDTTNEMQTLSITGQTLRISKRNSVTLPSLDTTSLSNRINQRVKYTDTASMLAPYLRDADTASLSNRIIKNRQAIIDTATSLRNKINAHIAADLDTDTTNEMQTLSITGQTLRISKRNSVTLPSIDTTSLSNRINQRVKYTDTASMLAPYLRDADTASLSNRINKKLNANDTISLSNRINQRVKYTDTASMLAPYLRDADTASLSNRINNNRQAIIDTATSLRNKINAHIASDLDIDTTNEMQTLSITGQTLRISKRNSVTLPSIDTTSLSNRINQRVKYTDTASMLAPYLRDADTASLNNRINKKLNANDTISLSNRINQRVKYTDTASMLAPYLRDADTTSLSNRINKNRQAIIDTATSLRNKINAHIAADLDTDTTNEMQTLSITGQTLRISKRNSVTLPSLDTTSLSNRINQRVKYTDTASMLAPYLRDADTASLSNRINKKLNANDTTSLSNRINQRVKYTDTASMLAPYLRDADTTSLSNRINKKLNANDTISLSNRINQRVRISDTASMLSKYLRKGDTIAMLNNYIYNANNGLTKSGKTAQLGGSLIQATTITTNGTNTLALAGLTSGNKSNDSILVAVASTGVIKRISPTNLTNGFMKYTDTASISNRINQRVRISDTASMLSKYIYNANNGLTKSGKTAQLGGPLIQATTITTSGTNTLALAGLSSGSINDSLLVINGSSNVIKRINASFLKPTIIKTTTTQANSSNTVFADVNTLQFSYVSGKKYKVKIYLVYNSAATGTGIRLRPNAISGNYWYSYLVNISATTNNYISGFNAVNTLVSTSSRATTANVAVLEYDIEATSNGTFSFQFASEVNGSAITIQSNSRLEVQEIP